MTKKIVTMLTVSVLLAGLCGCGKTLKETGFLSDYSKLQKESDTSLRYVKADAIQNYSGFMVDPVKIIYSPDAKSKDKLTEQQITDLTSYTNMKIREAVEKAGKKIVYEPGTGVARIRVALTDLEKASLVTIIPQINLIGLGIGGASMEAEVVDSVTGVQVGAVVESGKGSRIPFTNLGDWSSAKHVIDGWTDRFQKRLEETKQ